MPNSFDRTAYPSIPPQLWIHYDRLCVERPQHRLVEAVRTQGAETTWRAINEIVALASQATGLPPDQFFNSSVVLALMSTTWTPLTFRRCLGFCARSISLLNLASQEYNLCSHCEIVRRRISWRDVTVGSILWRYSGPVRRRIDLPTIINHHPT